MIMDFLFDQIKQFTNSMFWFESITDLTIKGTLILIFAFFAAFVWKKSSASIRHSILYLAIICILAIPLLSYILPAWEIPVLNSVLPQKTSLSFSENGQQNKLIKDQQTDQISNQKSNQTNLEKIVAKPNTASKIQVYINQFHWSKWLQIFWLIGALAIFIRLLLGFFGTWKTVKHSIPIENTNLNSFMKKSQKKLKINKKIILRKSSDAKVPMTIGWFRSIIILPTEALSWSTKRKEIILLHELAHIKRKDVLSTFITHLASIFYWFNPLIWISLQQMYIERERASDDFVLSNGTKASDYAHHLLEIAKKVNVNKWASPVGVAMAQKYKLEDRLMSILNNKKQRNGLKPSTTCLVILLAFSILIPVSSVQTWAQKENLKEDKIGKLEIQEKDVKKNVYVSTRVEFQDEQDKKQKVYETITIKYDKDSNYVYLVYDDEKPKKLDFYQTKTASLDKWSLYEDEDGQLVLKFKKDDKDSSAFYLITKPNKDTFSIITDSTTKDKFIRIHRVEKKEETSEINSQDEEEIKNILGDFYKNIESMDFLGAMKFLSERGDIKKKIVEKLPQDENSARNYSIGAATRAGGSKKLFYLKVEVKKQSGSETIDQKLFYDKIQLTKININSEILDIKKTENGYIVKEKLNLTAESENGAEHKIFDDLTHNYTFLQKDGKWKIKGKNLFSKISITAKK